jgi:hypothetical protein
LRVHGSRTGGRRGIWHNLVSFVFLCRRRELFPRKPFFSEARKGRPGAAIICG